MTPSLRLGGRYLLETRIGQGGMSEVWRATDEVLNRPVAIKVLAGAWLEGRDAQAVIRNEALAAARLSHPNIASVYDFAEGRDEHGRPVAYIVMELLNGDPLPDLLADGPLDADTAARVAADVAAALSVAHAHGLVHRDVKPGNVIVTPFGAKVFDFGIAATAGEPDRRDEQGRILGTAVFVSPERLSGGTVTPASDMYAFGVLLRRLFGSAPPSDVERLILRCLAADPATRPTAAQACEALSGPMPLLAARPVGVAQVESPTAPAATGYLAPPAPAGFGWRLRHRRRSTGAAALLLVVLGLSLMGLAVAAPGAAPVVGQFAAVPAPSPTPPKPAVAAVPAAGNAAPSSRRCDAVQAYARALGRLGDELRKHRGRDADSNGNGNGRATYPISCPDGAPALRADR